MIRSICLAIGNLVFVTNGETLLVPSQYPTIQEAANAAVPGDVIQIAAGTYQEFDIVCSDVTILGETGNSGIPVTRVDSSNLGRSLLCSGGNISIRNIEFINSSGNAIEASNVGDFALDNCVLTKDDNSNDGILIVGNDVVITNSRFNKASLSFTATQVQVAACHFENSTCFYSGSSTIVENCMHSGFTGHTFRDVAASIVSVRTFKNSLCYLEHQAFTSGALSMTIDDAIGTFLANFTYGSQGEILNSTIEGVGSFSLPGYSDPPFVVRCDSQSTLSLSNSTISNNIVTNGSFNAAILNSSITPILIEDSVVCGNTPLNIYGPYSLENSFLLPNCGSFEGSCCFSSECLTVTEEECISLGGSWRGTNVPCSSVTCAPPDQFGTCCVNDESVKLFESDCNRIGGTFEGSVPDGFVCPPSLTCEGDITNNGDVGLPDLIAVLSNWGPCPG